MAVATDVSHPLKSSPAPRPLANVDLSGIGSDLAAFALSHSPQVTRASAVYVVSNEKWPPSVYEHLQSAHAAEGSGHLGISSMRNFDIMAARHSKFGILVNDCKSMERAVAIMLDVVAHKALSRDDFCSKLEHAILNSPCGKFVHASSHIATKPNKTLEARLKAELTRSGSWLSTDESFSYIQRLARAGAIFNVRANVCDSDSVGALSHIFKNREVSLDTVYWSNVLELTFDCELAGQIQPGAPWSARAFMDATSILARDFPGSLVVAAQRNGAGQLCGEVVQNFGTMSVNSFYQFTETDLAQTSFTTQSSAFRER